MKRGRKKTILVTFDRSERVYRLFKASIHNQATQKTYDEALTRFMKFAKISSFNVLAKQKEGITKRLLENYLMHLQDRFEKKEIKVSYFRPPLNAIQLFLISNDVDFSFKKFKKMIPSDEAKISGDKPYTTQDIQRMEQKADLRAKALLYFHASTGVRGGANYDFGAYLKFKHMKRYNDGCIGILIYPDTKYEHPVFLTPEAGETFDDYSNYRIINGERLTQESPLFRNVFRPKQADKNIQPLTKPSTDAILRRLAEKSGVRVRGDSPYERHDKRTTYGFRLRWNTIMKNHEPRLNDNKIERMFSHTSKRMPMDKGYNKPEMDILHDEFVKAILALTISDKIRDKIELEKQQLQIDDLLQKQIQIHKLEEQQNATSKKLEVISDKVFSRYNIQLDTKKELTDEDLDIIADLIRSRMDIDPEYSASFKKMVNEDPNVSEDKKKRLSSI